MPALPWLFLLLAPPVHACSPPAAARDLVADLTVATEAVRPEAPTALRERALSTPLMNQHTAGGSFPGGYCAITAGRMLLRLEGLEDPGADAVALRGAHGAPYTQGDGTFGGRLDLRLQELGLAGATYTTGGRLASIKASLDQGHPVPVGGEGYFYGSAPDGSSWEHTYGGSGHWMLVVGATTTPDGTLTGWVVNDPDTGQRWNVSPAVMEEFLGGDGKIWMITYGR